MTESIYPEHMRMEELKKKFNTNDIGEFLEWLESKGYVVCELKEGCYGESYQPTGLTLEKLIAGYIDIDLNKIAKEKDMMLEEIRKANRG